jgi:leucyl-tRNA synthetase
MKPSVDQTIHDLLNERLLNLEAHFNSDVLSYYGAIRDGAESTMRKIVEDLAVHPDKKDSLFVMITTGGGSAIAVERYVNIFRHHYSEVNFIVPDYAYSAGTILCMSGDNIYMDYASVLGPIDPQVENKEGNLVAALGYLDKINEMIAKAQSGTLSNAEFLILKDFDLAELRSYEQAKELAVALLKKWLVKYKFKNWATHQTNPALIGTPVTPAQKEQRALEIADQLSDNKLWKSHGRPINIEILRQDLRLQIEDYSNNAARKDVIRSYYELLADYVVRNGMPNFVHTRTFI